jgi:hypothetical protein
MIGYLDKQKALRRGIDRNISRDIMWALTSRDLYRMLVRERKWSSLKYEDWLADTPVSTLIGPSHKSISLTLAAQPGRTRHR